MKLTQNTVNWFLILDSKMYRKIIEAFQIMIFFFSYNKNIYL